MTEVEVRSHLAAPAAAVWDGAITAEGITYELAPWLAMTMPRGLRGATIEAVPLGVVLGRSWILFGGVVPIDFDDLTLVERGPGRFVERSQLASARMWRHERTVAARPDGGCELTDRLGFELRVPLRWIPGGTAAFAAMIRAVFAHRHRRLRARHGGQLIQIVMNPAAPRC